MGFFDLPRAMMLSSQNAEMAEAYKIEAKAVRKRAKSLDDTYGHRLQRYFDKDLAVVAAGFARIRSCTLDEGDLGLTTRLPPFSAFAPPSRDVSVRALRRLIDLTRDGAAPGTAPAPLTLAAVSAMAAAAGAEELAGLTGPPATSSVLEWLASESPHVGQAGVAGGTALITGVVVLPAGIGTGLWLARVGSRELAKQEKVASDLKKAKASLKRHRALVDQIETSIKRATKALRHLAARVRRLLSWLDGVLARTDDYDQMSEEERHCLATLAVLAASMLAIMACPIVLHVPRRKGRPATKTNDLLPATVAAAEALLVALPGGLPGDEAAGDATLGDPGESSAADGAARTRGRARRKQPAG
jgi:hypothetical protein